VVGDFNYILHSSGRLRISGTNRSGENLEIREFGDFVTLIYLIDLPQNRLYLIIFGLKIVV
jgi:hypothetical protein